MGLVGCYVVCLYERISGSMVLGMGGVWLWGYRDDGVDSWVGCGGWMICDVWMDWVVGWEIDVEIVSIVSRSREG